MSRTAKNSDPQLEALYDSNLDSVLLPTFQDKYIAEMTALSKNVARLNVYTSLIQKFIDYRLDLFGGYGNRTWGVIACSLFESCILIIYKIVFDPNGDSVTLRQMKNSIYQNLKTDELKKEFSKKLKQIEFENEMCGFEKEVARLRHKIIAHLDRKELYTSIPTILKDFKEFTDDLNRIIENIKDFSSALCLGYKLDLLPHDHMYAIYGLVTDKEIETLLNSTLKSSPAINLPERDPEAWKIWKQRLSGEEIKIFNENRRRCSLPPRT